MLPPPKHLVNDESVVIVSTKRPICVYFNRILDLVSSNILSKRNKIFQIVIIGSGGAIGRCQQISRYVLREIDSRYKSIVKSTTKKSHMGQELAPTYLGDSIYDMVDAVRSINTIRIEIDIQL